LRHREVTMSLFFTLNFLRKGPAGGAFDPDGQGGYRPRPHILALRWFHEAANGGASYQRFVETNARLLPGGGVLGESYREVEAGMFIKPKVTTLIIQNCSAQKRVVLLPNAVSEKAPTQVETLPTTELTSTSPNIELERLTMKSRGAIAVPAYSLTRITWTK